MVGGLQERAQPQVTHPTRWAFTGLSGARLYMDAPTLGYPTDNTHPPAANQSPRWAPSSRLSRQWLSSTPRRGRCPLSSGSAHTAWPDRGPGRQAYTHHAVSSYCVLSFHRAYQPAIAHACCSVCRLHTHATLLFVHRALTSSPRGSWVVQSHLPKPSSSPFCSWLAGTDLVLCLLL